MASCLRGHFPSKDIAMGLHCDICSQRLHVANILPPPLTTPFSSSGGLCGFHVRPASVWCSWHGQQLVEQRFIFVTDFTFHISVPYYLLYTCILLWVNLKAHVFNYNGNNITLINIR